MKIIVNASQPAKVFYGLHMQPGTAEYVNKEGKAYKVFINEDTIRNMNPTFKGKPVYVDHVDKVNLEKVQEEAAGWVVRSFYNKADGNTWTEFLIVSDEGHDAIRRGWKLSNAYVPTNQGPGGIWHGMKYEEEILGGEYDHLAIVPNPRYEESIILDPEQFKAYNESKEADLLKIANSANNKKQGEKSMFKLFNRKEVDNSSELEGLMVTVAGKDMTVKNAFELAQKFLNMSGYAADEHMVKVNDTQEMSVKELRDCYKKMNDEMEMNKKKNAEMTEEEKKKNAEEEEKKKNEAKMEEEKKANEAKEMEESKKNSIHFETLRNAVAEADSKKENVLVLNNQRVDLGKQLF